MSQYPVGATWEARVNGKIAKIRLHQRNRAFEMWMWSVIYEDGSGYRNDWSTSYRSCREEIPIYDGNKVIRFKRIK
jgi:hypothetical protein